ncbi:MAG: hypothetical protein DCC71_02130 [Proteobacteria bacterium]|nr:MAG: hypothetical protein DCC71_02130 [Pseudomonadota bacterium]
MDAAMPAVARATARTTPAASAPARTLILTHRRVDPIASRCATFEFEDLIRAVDAVDVFPLGRPIGATLRPRLRRWTAAALAPLLPPVASRTQPYELLFVSLHSLGDLARLLPLPRFASAARRTACNVDELWLSQLRGRAHELSMLRGFDVLFTACRGAVDEIQRLVGRPCHYLAPAVDTLRFCPGAPPRSRTIDVYFMGRRRPALHRAVQQAAAARDRLYLFDTAIAHTVHDPVEHREQLAELVRRTRYFVVDVAKADRADESSRQPEIGTRFFEGAAGGAVMFGVVPDTRAFVELFPWDDAAIPVEPDPARIAALLDELDASRERVAAIRRANVVGALRRHDGAYRWREVLAAVGLEPLPALSERVRELELRADSIEHAGLG